MMASELGIKDFDFIKLQIKQEKDVSTSFNHICDDKIILKFEGCDEASNTGQEQKLTVTPIKSSNEILAELFQVFNAAPPTILLNDDLLKKKEKKKHKSRKHKKKSKKCTRSSSSENSTISQSSNYKNRKKKKKKEKKEKKHKSYNETSAINEANETLENEKLCAISELPVSEDEGFGISSTDVDNVYKNLAEADKSIESSRLKETTVPKKVEHKGVTSEKKFYEKETLKEGSSDLSLSDEETYLKEKQFRYYSSKNSYERKSRHKSSRRYSSRDRSKKYFKNSRSRSRSRSKDRHRNRSRSYRSGELFIDKKRLLEIARKNAILMFKNGSLPGTNAMTQEVKNKVLMKMRYGGKTVEELTEFCKKLSKGKSLNDLSSLSSNDDSDHDKDGNEKPFHHPFAVKDRGPIVMNIKNATQIAPKTSDQTKAILMQYPVSSGQQHRLNETEWIPVAPKNMESTTISLKIQSSKNIFQKPLPPEKQQKPAFIPNPQHQPLEEINSDTSKNNIELSPTRRDNLISTESVFSQEQNLDVSSIITRRLNAMRKLQENPADPQALQIMYNSQKDMSAWATSKYIPGQFTGSTGANILTAKELTAGQQAWVKKDQLTSSAPVSGGMGMHLLQKMGWRPGEGLGKGKNGSLQPLLLEVKLDKRGLLANEEDPSASRNQNKKSHSVSSIEQLQQSMENKHPVSLLGELSAKRRWGAPSYELVNENGPAHQKNFIFKVVVNGMMYQPAIACNTKKDAKALAAKYCLQQIGILPS